MSSWWSSSKAHEASSNRVSADDDASIWSNPFTKVASNQSLASPSRDADEPAAPGASSWANPFKSATSRDDAAASQSAGYLSNPFASSNKSSGSGALGGGSGSKWINVDAESVAYARGELTGENSEFKRWGIELTRQQRIIGFVACVFTGFIMSLLGTILLITGSHTAFAVLYSVGVLISLTGTGFLIGFLRQLKLMFKPVRVVATGLMIGAFVMVWVSAFVLNWGWLALVFCIVLYLCYLWYALSYVPGARNFLKSIVAKLW